MHYFYSPSTEGFYLDELHSAIPRDAIEITETQYQQLLQGQSQGKQIVINAKGEVLAIEPAPSVAHYWNGSEWAIDESKQAELRQNLVQTLIDKIDNQAAEITAHWTRFAEEYKEREKAALDFQQANFQGEASIYITSFSSVAGLDNKTATLLILQQATALRHLQEQLAVQRMRKYELKHAELTESQLNDIYQDITNNMQQLKEAHHG